MSAIVFDTGALIAFEQRRRPLDVLLAVRGSGGRVVVPAPCLAQAWRSPRTQVRLGRFLRLPSTDIVALDEDDARTVGQLLRRSATADVVDAHVALVARRLGAPVITSDPDDLRAIDPALDIVAL